jgi:hypothetical protein
MADGSPERRRHEDLRANNAPRLQTEDVTRIERECKPNISSKLSEIAHGDHEWEIKPVQENLHKDCF